MEDNILNTHYTKQEGGYNPEKHGRLSYDFMHEQLEKIRKNKLYNYYVIKNTSGYLKYKDLILKNINCRDQLLYIFVREYSCMMEYEYDDPIQDFESCLISCMSRFEDSHETVLKFQTSCKFNSGLIEHEDQDLDEAYKVFIHAVYRLTIFAARFKNFHLPPERCMAGELIDLIDDYYRYFQSSCASLDEYLLEYAADCIDKKQTA